MCQANGETSIDADPAGGVSASRASLMRPCRLCSRWSAFLRTSCWRWRSHLLPLGVIGGRGGISKIWQAGGKGTIPDCTTKSPPSPWAIYCAARRTAGAAAYRTGRAGLATGRGGVAEGQPGGRGDVRSAAETRFGPGQISGGGGQGSNSLPARRRASGSKRRIGRTNQNLPVSACVLLMICCVRVGHFVRRL